MKPVKDIAVKAFKIIKLLLIILSIPLVLFIAHSFLIIYTKGMSWFWVDLLKFSDSSSISINTLGDSLGALAFIALVYSLWQTSKDLQLNREELKLSREEMEKTRKEHEEGNDQRMKSEVMANCRTLIENIEIRNRKPQWIIPERNSIIRTNLLEMFNSAIPILVELTKNESNLLSEFAKNVLLSNNGDLKYKNLSSVNFENISPHYVSLVGTNLTGAKFKNTELNGTYFINSIMKHITFENSQLRGAKFIDAMLTLGDFTNANIEDADFSNSYMRFVKLINVNMMGSRCENVYFYGADFKGANISNSNFRNSNFDNADLRYTNNYKYANFNNSMYSEKTKFPSDFNPEKHNMEKIPTELNFK